jgi:hypothetical protein
MLLKKNVSFSWSQDCETAFQRVKAMLTSAPVLSAPNFDRPFKLAVDASDVAVGAVLLQEDSNGLDHPVCYFSRKLDKSQRNWRECLALILAQQHFEIYVTASNSAVTVFSDHNPLVFLHKIKDKNQRVVQWSLCLQEYYLDIQHIKGKDNLIADCLSTYRLSKVLSRPFYGALHFRCGKDFCHLQRAKYHRWKNPPVTSLFTLKAEAVYI